jgi:hypothetical protein
MTAPARSVAPAWGFALAALGLTLAKWLWFVLCFTARVAAWCNSVWLFATLYLIAFLLALRSVHSWLGIIALVVSASSLGVVSVFIFG